PREAYQPNPIGRNTGKVVVGDIRSHDTKNDIKLKESHKPAAPVCGRYFRDIHRAYNRRRSYSNASNKPEKQKRIPIDNQSASECRNQINTSHPLQYELPAIPLYRFTANHRTDDRTNQGNSNRKAVPIIGWSIHLLDSSFSTRNDRGIEAEQEAPQRRHEGDLEHIVVDFDIIHTALSKLNAANKSN